MAITKYPNGVSSFGGVVGPPNYAGWWGKNVWFVNDDAGSDEHKGNDPEKALKTIQKAIDLAGPHDTIFLKPRKIAAAAYNTHGYYTGTNVIAADQQGLAIIGTGRGGRGIGMSVQCMIEPDSGSTDITMLVQSPGVSIENVGLKCVEDADGAISAYSVTNQAYGLTVSNCFFKDYKSISVLTGTIQLGTIHWATIQHCLFKEAGVAIHLLADQATIETTTIRDCDFVGAASTWSEDIRIGNVKNLTITDCRFAHAQPSGGPHGANLYIDMVGTVGSGMVSNCTFAHNSDTLSDFMVLQGSVLNAHCWGNGQIIDD